MSKEKFVRKMVEDVVEENSTIYLNLFNNTDINSIRDEYWKKSLLFFYSIPENQRPVFFEILKQVSIDAVSNVLGIIDGSTSTSKNDPVIGLVSDGEEIGGDLQTEFLNNF